MQEIFRFEKTGVGEDGQTLGRFGPTGIRPKFLSKILGSGIKLPPDMFGQ
jgi:pilus assembly protein CpaF